MSGKLTLTFDAGYGQEPMSMVLPLDDFIANQLARIRPPSDAPFGIDSFEQVVEILKRKEFRKELFVIEARRLGTLLAERMEDAEGWHDASRIEPAKRQLKGR